MKKKGIAAFGDVLSNLATGHLKRFEYKRQPFPQWDVDANEYFLINNVNIIDVNLGKIRRERGARFAMPNFSWTDIVEQELTL